MANFVSVRMLEIVKRIAQHRAMYPRKLRTLRFFAIVIGVTLTRNVVAAAWAVAM